LKTRKNSNITEHPHRIDFDIIPLPSYWPSSKADTTSIFKKLQEDPLYKHYLNNLHQQVDPEEQKDQEWIIVAPETVDDIDVESYQIIDSLESFDAEFSRTTDPINIRQKI
jgi:hypothetical protein